MKRSGFLCRFVKKVMALPENPTDAQIMSYYMQKINSDYRTCYTGLDLLKSGYSSGSINEMIWVMKQFFVGVGMMSLVDFQELDGVRPGLLRKNNVFFDREEPFYARKKSDERDFHLSFIDSDFDLELSAGTKYFIQAYNCKIRIRGIADSHFEMQYGGSESKIDVELFGLSSGILINLNNAGGHTVKNNGAGIFKYKETSF